MTIIDLPRPRAVNTSGRAPDRRALHKADSHPRRLIKIAVASVLAIAVYLSGLYPQQLGGSLSYVITDGVSMLPHFHAGDLVILKREPSYRIGEVAAFHNKQLGVIVMHRIIAIDGERFTFKGDNNDFATSYRPTKAQIVGAEWLHLPTLGHLVVFLRTPIIAAVLLGLLWLFSFSPRSRSRRQRRRHRHAS